ncbi:MAG: glycyl-radical enzyme activating protein [Treponema sp.]|nr:glycyl-radical enzyme activating protein [Treponema sp.]
MNNREVRGFIFDIQRFSLHDGPGIRTNVFLKGCPLDCIWCHNPESKDPDPEIAYYPDKCVLCGACAAACPEASQRVEQGGHTFSRETCTRCGACAEACLTGALALIGRSVSAGEALEEVKKDEAFYRNSGGGMTISGGEPFFQSGFTLALLRLARESGLHTCVETGGAVPFDGLREAAAVTDLFLYDVKETAAEKHRNFTGVSNELIVNNLEKLDGLGARTVLRCPVIPGCNDRDDHLRGIAAIAGRLRNVTGIEIEPYHPLGISKALSIGKPSRHTDTTMPPKETARAWADVVQACTSVPVKVV